MKRTMERETRKTGHRREGEAEGGERREEGSEERLKQNL